MGPVGSVWVGPGLWEGMAEGEAGEQGWHQVVMGAATMQRYPVAFLDRAWGPLSCHGAVGVVHRGNGRPQKKLLTILWYPFFSNEKSKVQREGKLLLPAQLVGPVLPPVVLTPPRRHQCSRP